MSLHLSRDLFHVFKGTVFSEALESLFDKILALLSPDTLAYLEKIQSIFHMGIRPYKNYARYRELIAQVNQAAMDQRCIEIAYQSLTATLRKIHPYKIWFYEGTIYIVGHCHLRNQIRSFVLDRVHMLKVLIKLLKFRINSTFNSTSATASRSCTTSFIPCAS